MRLRLLKIFGLVTIIVVPIFFAGGTMAAQDAPASDHQVFTLGEVVVTGNSETITKVATVDTVDKERIKLTNATNVSDAIDTLPGVSISVGRKNERNINIRGFNQRYVPVLYDGIPIYIANDGYVDTGKLPTGNISRISVTKGISSVLYGPNTMAGVVNIVSMKPQAALEADVALMFREEDTWETYLNLGSRLDKFYFSLSGGFLDSDGFPLSDDFDAARNEDGDTRNNSDKEQKNGAFKVGFLPAEGHEYAIGLNIVDSEWGLPPHADDDRPKYWRFTEWEKRTYYFVGKSKLSDAIKLDTRIYRDEYDNVLDSYDDDTYSTQTRRSSFHSTYDDYSEGGSAVLRTMFLPQSVVSGSFHYKKDVHKEQDGYGEDWEQYESELFSYGLEADIELTDRMSLVLGGSYDVQDPEYANGETVRGDDDSFNPQAGIFWQFIDSTDFHASVGKKTRFPTLHELYSDQLGRNEANPNLAKEEAVNYEIGLSHDFDNGTVLSVNLFRSDIDDKIVEKEIAPKTDKYLNLGEARHQGFEATVTSRYFAKHQLEIHYTYVDAENRSPGRTSDNLEEVPGQQLYISDRFQIIPRICLFGKFEWNDEQYEEDYSGTWKTLGSYWLVDTKVIGTISENFTIEAGVTNLFDENYFLSEGFPREGRTFFTAIRATF